MNWFGFKRLRKQRASSWSIGFKKLSVILGTFCISLFGFVSFAEAGQVISMNPTGPNASIPTYNSSGPDPTTIALAIAAIVIVVLAVILVLMLKRRKKTHLSYQST